MTDRVTDEAGESDAAEEQAVAPSTPLPLDDPPAGSHAAGAADAGATDAGETAPDEEQAEVRGLDRRVPLAQRTRLAWTVAGIATVLALLGIIGSVLFGMRWADLHAVEQDRQEVRETAREVALRLTTFEGENIEQWLTDARAQATGDYKQQLAQVFDQGNRDALREIEVVSRGEVESLFVQEVRGDTASVFAVMRQTYVNARTEDPVEDQLRVDMTLTRVKDEWLASEVAVLGPPGVVAPTGQPGAAPPTGDE